MALMTCECCGQTVFVCGRCADGASTVTPTDAPTDAPTGELQVVGTHREAVEAGWSENAKHADPWGLVEPLIEQFVTIAPAGRAGLCQYMFAAQDNSPFVKAFRELGGIERAVKMTLPCSLDEEIMSKFRVPGLDTPQATDVAACLIQLGSFFGLPQDLRALPSFSDVDPTVLSQRERA
jgi:hypothetical protein